MIKLKVSGIKKELARVNDSLRTIGETQSLVATKSIVNDLKEATPVDTGEARDGWTYTASLKKGVYQITNEVDHIAYLNAGTSEQAPAHFIEQTILSNKKVSPDGEIVTYR